MKEALERAFKDGLLESADPVARSGEDVSENLSVGGEGVYRIAYPYLLGGWR